MGPRPGDVLGPSAKTSFFPAAKSPLTFAPLPPSPTLWGLRGQYKRPCFVFTRAHVTFRGSKEAAKTSFRFSSGDGRVTWRAVVGAVGGKVVDEGRPVTKPSRQGEAASGRRQRRRVVSVVVRRTARPADVRSYARRQLVEPTENIGNRRTALSRAHTAKRASGKTPSVWNSMPQTVLISDSLSAFKCRHITFLFTQAFTH